MKKSTDQLNLFEPKKEKLQENFNWQSLKELDPLIFKTEKVYTIRTDVNTMYSNGFISKI